MLGMGMASAQAPMMFQKAQHWPRMVERIPVEAREHLPHSALPALPRSGRPARAP